LLQLLLPAAAAAAAAACSGECMAGWVKLLR